MKPLGEAGGRGYSSPRAGSAFVKLARDQGLDDTAARAYLNELYARY
ncbi:hypothetical protein [Actinopolymorpha pittospori]|uniref:Uncharacterized protein n=1 Tax=Actinopolymorpha pittospori TaxID=648752 RepID=A0A927MP97_9ACTN|nr:hypothetical protein [Actinopolymorpha pittospori]MBE1604179.1 hypothetical protein [Actinopolymorpha pittospori]